MSTTPDVSLFTGRYSSKVDNTGNPTPSSINGNVTGQIKGDLIIFTVNWDKYTSLTTWVGQYNPSVLDDNYQILMKDKPEKIVDLITTLWMMTSHTSSYTVTKNSEKVDLKDLKLEKVSSRKAVMNSGTDTFFRKAKD
ncbi:avidin/streptavidin family protein [Photorhabdus noenieputensis]|nr:avidin/streptavidin family protein [Photorhabdus noenieputensis]MCK3671263.1 avidin/streptavidin family protein [Photorhabdus noenieputensis]